MLFASDAAILFAVALLFTSRNQKKTKAYKDVCVSKRFDLSDMDCICLVWLLCSVVMKLLYHLR